MIKLFRDMWRLPAGLPSIVYMESHVYDLSLRQKTDVMNESSLWGWVGVEVDVEIEAEAGIEVGVEIEVEMGG